MRKTLKYRLYRSKRDIRLIRQIHAASSIWNHSVALTRRYYRRYGKSLSKNRLQKHIAKLRNRNPYWQELGSQAVQDVTDRLYKAYDRFFKDPKAGLPRFKSYRHYSSFTLKQAGWKYLGGNRIRIGKTTYKFCLSRPIPTGIGGKGNIKTVTIKRDRVGDLWVCFSVVTDDQFPAARGYNNPVGMDFGLKQFLTMDDGSRIESPRFFGQNRKALKKAQRKLARKQKGSNNRFKARKPVARIHRHTAAQRRDWFFKLAHALCEAYDLIGLEDLNLEGMKRLWGRKVSDLAFGEFVSVLEHVAKKRGVVVQKVDRFFASSQRCHGCGHKQELALNDRSWRCEGCGVRHDRDVNAAKNIRDRALSLWLGDSKTGEASAKLAVAA